MRILLAALTNWIDRHVVGVGVFLWLSSVVLILWLLGTMIGGRP